MFNNKNDGPKYLQLYNYYKKLILNGMMKEGEKMPSVRKCSSNFNLSRTTIETAYEMLSAEGYIFPIPQSGYYVCKVNFEHFENIKKISDSLKTNKYEIKYDLATTSADLFSFNFSLWRRYIKSALRQDIRLLSYGEPQGEFDLREAICNFAEKERGVICSPSQIVIAAGTQSLIGLLCSLTKAKENVSFIGSKFDRAIAVFEDHGKKIDSILQAPVNSENFQKLKSSLIYTSPSHINSVGGVLSFSERKALLEFANKNDCLVIEDDYDSEFRYGSKPMPSLQGMNGGENVVYIGTFSKLLLPSIRISFMILPLSLTNTYFERKNLYNQTASKLEQIALCQFIRDGHLASQIRKQKKQYQTKSKYICAKAEEILPDTFFFKECIASYLIEVKIKTSKTAKEICEIAFKKGLKIKPIGEDQDFTRVLISIAGFNLNNTEQMLEIFKSII